MIDRGDGGAEGSRRGRRCGDCERKIIKHAYPPPRETSQCVNKKTLGRDRFEHDADYMRKEGDLNNDARREAGQPVCATCQAVAEVYEYETYDAEWKTGELKWSARSRKQSATGVRDSVGAAGA